MIAWLSAFLFTQAVEVPVYALLLRGRARGWWAWALVPSAVTHPVVWFVMPRLFADWWTMLVVAETFAVLVEAAILWRWRGPASLGWALLANAASLGLGLSSRALFGWP